MEVKEEREDLLVKAKTGTGKTMVRILIQGIIELTLYRHFWSLRSTHV